MPLIVIVYRRSTALQILFTADVYRVFQSIVLLQSCLVLFPMKFEITYMRKINSTKGINHLILRLSLSLFFVIALRGIFF